MKDLYKILKFHQQETDIRLEQEPENVVLQSRIALINNLITPFECWLNTPPRTIEEILEAHDIISQIRERVLKIDSDPMYSEIEKFN